MKDELILTKVNGKINGSAGLTEKGNEQLKYRTLNYLAIITSAHQLTHQCAMMPLIFRMMKKWQ
jgi:hypothetical protein